jgi:hypothetical protein
MSTIEDPVTTTIRLLSSNIYVVKDDGSVAAIYVSEQWYDRELFKSYDAQVTVGLLPVVDRKVGQAGLVRQMVGKLVVNLWSMDRPKSSDTGREIRKKLVEQIKVIVHENMKVPNQTVYNFYGEGYPSGTPHQAFQSAAASELLPSSSSWTEISPTQYQDIWSQDNVDYSNSTSVNLDYALMLFKFQIASKATTVQQIVLSFVGYGTAPSGNRITIKVWNVADSAWESASTGSGSSNQTVTITLTSSLTNYIDSNGCVWLLARTTNSSNGTTAAVLNCDYASCTVTVNGITYLDIISYSDKDKVDIKPFLYRTEFFLKSWSFENVYGTY